MDKVKISNTINRLGCGDELLYCTRVYVNARIYGGAWIPMEWFLNTTFWLLRGQKFHCKKSWLYERRRSNASQKKANQIRSEKTEGETSGY